VVVGGIHEVRYMSEIDNNAEEIVKTQSEPKYRRPLNKEQLSVLRILYRFRFSTSEQIARYCKRSSNKHIQKRLKILEDQGLIGKRYDSSYKLRGKPAAYYLTPKGARLLKETPQYGKYTCDNAIKSLYKNKTVSEEFIRHNLTVLNAYLKLKELYGDNIQCFTHIDMLPHDHFPDWSPDLYIRLDKKNETSQFFLDVFDDTKPFFVHVQKARHYLQYSEDGNWGVTDEEFPVVLAICDTKRNETKLRRQIRKAVDESYEEVAYATTTMEALEKSTKGRDEIWRMSDEEDELLRLVNISVDR
jgi:DNA-binding HxlR family transcriptional regulator